MIDAGAIVAGFGLGLGLGVVTGLPLGVVNVAVVATAARRGRRSATWLGLGGAVADGIHAALAFTGLAALIAARPRASAALALVAGVVLCAAAVLLVRGREEASANTNADAALSDGSPRASAHRTFGLGLAMTLPNPAALTAWIAVASTLALRDRAAAVAAAIGVTIGSAAYFAALAAVAARAGAATPPRRRAVTVIAAAVIGGLGLIALGRGAWALTR